MNKLFMIVGFGIILAGCGASQKDLRTIDNMIEQSKSADCETIRGYLDAIQTEVRKKIK